MTIGSRALAATLLCAAAAAHAQATPAERIDSVHKYVMSELARTKTPGISIGVLRGDNVIISRGYGLANVELNVPASDSTIYQSGSMGKQFTAAGVMLLVESGKLKLTDTITKWFPEGKGKWDGITVRHLLTHTSGVGNYFAGLDMRNDYSDDSLVKNTAAQPMLFQPGARWVYSNSGYMLLGILIKRVTGQFYGDFLKENVFGPAGMKTTRVISEVDIVPNRADGYAIVRGELKNQEWVSPTLNSLADGALYLTIKDLTAWAITLNHKRIPSPAGLDLMWTQATLNDGSKANYGFGWTLDQQNGKKRIGHGGAWQGFLTVIARYPEYDLTVIALANSRNSAVSNVGYTIAGILEPDLRVAPRPNP